MLDHVNVISWAIVYLLVIINGIKIRPERGEIMPRLPGCLNLAWELNAIAVSGGHYGHVLWAGLNIGIYVLNLSNIHGLKSKLRYFALTMALLGLFNLIFRLDDGMLISSFAINAVMSLIFVCKVKIIPQEGKISIAVLKLIGSAAAWVYYMPQSLAVFILGAIYILLDLFYLCCCFEEQNRRGSVKRRGDKR